MATGLSMLDRLTGRNSTLEVKRFTTLEDVTFQNREKKLGCDGPRARFDLACTRAVHT
ncbi:hypothetical protein BD311DRAFT_830922 [Dichomitus squalens]|uniref:Uncharacterized protein n=1 Tax=Dichomitus squalens TaxID=114155 RepID=A0A4Q9MQT7_9APHY|nr:hypothetical protein BD311DRAFT_830922 [Dichomitus squalens]